MWIEKDKLNECLSLRPCVKKEELLSWGRKAQSFTEPKPKVQPWAA